MRSRLESTALQPLVRRRRPAFFRNRDHRRDPKIAAIVEPRGRLIAFIDGERRMLPVQRPIQRVDVAVLGRQRQKSVQLEHVDCLGIDVVVEVDHAIHRQRRHAVIGDDDERRAIVEAERMYAGDHLAE